MHRTPKTGRDQERQLELEASLLQYDQRLNHIGAAQVSTWADFKSKEHALRLLNGSQLQVYVVAIKEIMAESFDYLQSINRFFRFAVLTF